MNGNSGDAGVTWSADVWQGITDAVVQEVAKIRIGQKVFPATMLDGDPTELQDQAIDFQNLSIREGRTKQFVEIYQEFPLTSTQVAKEATDKTCQTLSRMAAKALALAETSSSSRDAMVTWAECTKTRSRQRRTVCLGKPAQPTLTMATRGGSVCRSTSNHLLPSGQE